MPRRLPPPQLLLAAAAAAAAAAPWDLAVGRRPYVAEREGHLLFRAEASIAGLAVDVAASLPCVNKTWNWTLAPLSPSNLEHVLDLGSLEGFPEKLNNDMLISVSVGGRPSGTLRRRFQRAFKADALNTVQVDHWTSGLLVDGQPWAGWGWYVYDWSMFNKPWLPHMPDGRLSPNVCSNLTAHPESKADCTRWGVGNTTATMAEMARRGINVLMPYFLNPHEHDGIHGVSVEELEQLVLKYYDEAARHGLKVMFHMASVLLDRGHYTNATQLRLQQGVELVKDHPALLGYYICDDCRPSPAMTQAYNTIRNMDPYHITIGAGFPGDRGHFADSRLNPSGPSCQKHCGKANDGVAMLPSLTCNIPASTPCLAPWGGPNCSMARNRFCHTTCNNCEEESIPLTGLSLDVVMIENYNPSPEAHTRSDFGSLRKDVPWEPMVNCDGSYTLEEHSTPHKPPKVLQTNMWISTVVANTVNQLVFVGKRPDPMIGKTGNMRGAHPEKSFWGKKNSWMMYDQVELYSAQARVILPSLYAPFGLPQPTVNVTAVLPAIKAPTPKGFPKGKSVVARAWRQAADSGYCGHLVVASALEQSPATFTLKLGGSFPINSSWASLRAVRLFAADYSVPISGEGVLSDMIDAAGHNIYQIGDCGDPEPPPPAPPPPICTALPPVGCFDTEGLRCSEDLPCILPRSAADAEGEAFVHDRLTLEDCAGQCHLEGLTLAGIDAGNRCRCGSSADAASAVAKARARPLSECRCSSELCPCTGNESDAYGAASRLLVYGFDCHLPVMV